MNILAITVRPRWTDNTKISGRNELLRNTRVLGQRWLRARICFRAAAAIDISGKLREEIVGYPLSDKKKVPRATQFCPIANIPDTEAGKPLGLRPSSCLQAGKEEQPENIRENGWSYREGIKTIRARSLRLGPHFSLRPSPSSLSCAYSTAALSSSAAGTWALPRQTRRPR